jgi:hypothetical protein
MQPGLHLIWGGWGVFIPPPPPPGLATAVHLKHGALPHAGRIVPETACGDGSEVQSINFFGDVADLVSSLVQIFWLLHE